MTRLPWDVSELATKQDVAMLGKDLKADIERMARIVTVGVITANAVMIGGAAGLAQILS